MAWQSLYALGRRLRKGRERGDAPSGVRPSIPLALAAGLAFWAACACAVSAGEHLGAGGCMLLALGCAAAALAALPLFRAPRGAYAAAMLAATLAGALNGAAGSAMLHAQGEVPTAEAVPFVLRAVEDGSETAYGRRVLAQVEEGFAAGAKVQVLFGGDADVLHGQRFVAEGSLQAVSGSSAEFLWGKGCVLQLGAQEVEHSPGQGVRDAVAAVRAKAVERIGSRGGQDAALVAALACGSEPSDRGLGRPPFPGRRLRFGRAGGAALPEGGGGAVAGSAYPVVSSAVCRVGICRQGVHHGFLRHGVVLRSAPPLVP